MAAAAAARRHHSRDALLQRGPPRQLAHHHLPLLLRSAATWFGASLLSCLERSMTLSSRPRLSGHSASEQPQCLSKSVPCL